MTKRQTQIRLSESQLEFLEGLERLRICGDNVSEIVRRFVDEGIERIANEGTIRNIMEARDLLAGIKRENIEPITKKSNKAV